MANTYGFTFNPFTSNFDEILLTIDSGNVTGGTPNTFAGFDASGVLETIPSYSFDPSSKFGYGFQINHTSDPFPDAGSPTGYTINSIQSDIQPSGTTVNQNPVVFGFFSNLDQGNTSFDLNSFQNMSVQSGFNGNGTVGNVNFISAGFQNGNNSTTGTISNLQLLNLNSSNNSGQTLGNMTGINLNIQTQAGSINTGNIQIYGGGANIDGPITGGSGVSNFNMSGNITAAMQYMNGYGLSYNFQSGANLTNSLQSYQAASHFFSGSTVGGVTSYTANLQVDSGVTVNGGYTGYSDNPTIRSPLISSGVNGFSLGGQFSSTMQYMNGHGVFADYQSGTNITNGVSVFTDNSNAQLGSTFNYYTGVGIFPNFHSGSTITGQFQGINVNSTFDITVPQISLAQLSANGSGTTPQLTGLQINLSGMNSTNQKQGINVNDGNIQVNANYDTGVLPASPGFVNIHGIGGLYRVAPGFPVTNTLVLANNFGISSEFEDDFGPDGFGGFLGYVNNGLLSQLAIATGKTVDTFTSAAIAASVPALAITGGTITNANMLTVAGVINQGGTVSITNLKGINIPAGLFNSFSAANAWGIFVSDDTVDNWFAKDVVIGGTTGLPANGSVALEIQGTTRVFLNARLSTADENALTPQAGMQLFNNDTGLIDYYDGSSWLSLSTGAGFANQALSNLTTTSINQDLIPNADVTLNLGTSADRWNFLYVNQLYDGGNLSVDVIQRHLVSGGTVVTNWANQTLFDSAGTQSVTWDSRFLRDAGASASVGWDARQLINAASATMLDWSGTVVDVNTHKITNVVDPTAAQDAATKNYVDTTTISSALMTTAGDIIYENNTPAPARLPIGSTGQVLTVAGGLPAWTSVSGTTPITQKAIFTASTTWTVPASVTATTVVKVTSTGGGGGGGTGQSGGFGGGAGGGAGGTCIQWIDGTTLGATVAITVGANGVGGVGSASNGTSGGNTVFGAFHTAGGGGGGAGTAITTGGNAGIGGSATGGDINVVGGYGAGGGGGIAATLGGVAGTGGSSFYGGAGGVSNTGTSFNGDTGGGGGGNSGGAGDGGAGGVGIVTVEWIG